MTEKGSCPESEKMAMKMIFNHQSLPPFFSTARRVVRSAVFASFAELSLLRFCVAIVVSKSSSICFTTALRRSQRSPYHFDSSVGLTLTSFVSIVAPVSFASTICSYIFWTAGRPWRTSTKPTCMLRKSTPFSPENNNLIPALN